MKSTSVRFLTILILFLGLKGHGATGFGISGGIGLPYITQFGVDYHLNEMFSAHFNYNNLDLSVDTAKLKLTMPELLVYFHPFSGSFFIGGGLGQETLKSSARDSTTNLEASIEVKATTTIIKTGWVWGTDDGGFFGGLDYSYIMPSGASSTITAPGVPTTSKEYQDAVDAADKFGSTAYGNLTFLKIGYLF